jgi:hypothetical protein
MIDAPAGSRPLTFLFYMWSPSAYFRLFEAPIRLLAERGHHVHLAIEREGDMGGRAWLDALANEQPRFTWSLATGLRSDPWLPLTKQLRLARDYVQFLRPGFSDAPSLVARAEGRAQRRLRRALRHPLARREAALRVLSATLRLAEESVPPFVRVQEEIRAASPDAVLLVPHLMPGAPQSEYVRAAQALGVRTAVCVASWDNLSSKQLLRVVPDVVLVWNEEQRREAVELHAIPPERVAVTGAQVYDHWFDWQPRPREEFCARVGLPADRPYVLYLGGALFPAEITESIFVRRWLDTIRAHGDPALRDAAVLIRPHPKRGDEWAQVDVSGYDNVVVWPRRTVMPVAPDARADFYDSIFHSRSVAGLNTSAFIEAGIVGRPVHVIVTAEFAGSQDGVRHFRYLLEVGGGVVQPARTLEEHAEQLAASMRGAPAPDVRPFLERFVRPLGLERAATPVFADTVERLARGGPVAPRSVPLHLRPVGAALAPLARRLHAREQRARRRKEQRRRAGEAAQA